MKKHKQAKRGNDLEEQNARLKADVIEAKENCAEFCESVAEKDCELQSQLETANKRLGKCAWWVSHSVHKSWCGVNYGNNCSCGLGEALRALENFE